MRTVDNHFSLLGVPWPPTAPVIAALLLMLASFSMGCSESDEAAGRPVPNGTKVGMPRDQVQNPDALRKELRTKVELPDYYPGDAPIYPGTMTNNAGRRNGRVTAVFSTEDSTEVVSEYILAKLGSLDWTDVSVHEMPNGHVIHAVKEVREISVLVSSMDEGTEYELTMMVVAVDP
jgi:hypothetical protein